MLKLWHDDIRRPPNDSWNWARTNKAAKKLLLRQPYTVASLDHDMGLHDYDPDIEDADYLWTDEDWPQEDGEELARWMVKNNCVPPYIRIHSFNPVGARTMRDILKDHAKEVIVHPFDPRWRDRDPLFPEEVQ